MNERQEINRVRLTNKHGYQTSRDYHTLYDVAHLQSVVCFVDYHECRDVAATLLLGDVIEISARGIGYVYATSKSEFSAQCEKLNVEFILPDPI